MNARTLVRLIFAALLAVDAASVGPGRLAPPDRRSGRVGGQRGTELEVNFTGQRLGDAQEILFYQPGISATKIEAVDDNHVKATIKIDADAELGLLDLRVRTATGVSELRTFSVGALKETTEVEPNDEFAKPQKIEFGSVVNGVARSEDVDYYAFEAKKGERITAEVEGARLGIALFDPYVAIMDSKRFELASSDDAALIWQDGVRLGRRPGGRDVHRPGPRERLRRDRRLPLSAPRRQLPPADRHGPGRRQVRRDDRRPPDRRRPRREDDQGHPARRSRSASSASSPATTRGPPPTPTPSGSRPSAT